MGKATKRVEVYLVECKTFDCKYSSESTTTIMKTKPVDVDDLSSQFETLKYNKCEKCNKVNVTAKQLKSEYY